MNAVAGSGGHGARDGSRNHVVTPHSTLSAAARPVGRSFRLVGGRCRSCARAARATSAPEQTRRHALRPEIGPESERMRRRRVALLDDSGGAQPARRLPGPLRLPCKHSRGDPAQARLGDSESGGLVSSFQPGCLRLGVIGPAVRAAARGRRSPQRFTRPPCAGDPLRAGGRLAAARGASDWAASRPPSARPALHRLSLESVASPLPPP